MSTITNYRDPNRGFRVFKRDELVAASGTGRWVPNIGDLVLDPEQGFFMVTDVDPGTGYSTLVKWFIPEEPEENRDQDVLLGAGPGYPSESYRVFVDTTVTPHTLSPDSRLRFYGSMVHSYKVFLGSDISSEHGTVISTFFDPSGNFLGDSIPVEVVEVPNAVQSVIKAPASGYTNRKLDNGELVTLVAYDQGGGVVSIAQLIVRNSSVIRRVNEQKSYVKGISIESPFISSADPQTIEFPVNVTVESLPMTGIVHYSNARHRLPIDGNKFKLYGMRNYVASVVGQSFPLVLTYQLAEDEVAYGSEPTADNKITIEYTAKTTAADGAYEVKLFIFPVWVNAQVGYRLEYWLYNLDRETFYNATPYIELGTNSAPFNPTLYGVVQTVTVALDLNRVDGVFLPYRHVQTVQVALLNRGDDTHANWTMFMTPDQQQGYGTGLYAGLEFVSVNQWRLKLANGLPTKELWLKTLYERVEPLVNTETEAFPLTPTHFRVVFLHNTYELSVDQWNEDIMVNNDLQNGELMYIQWIRRTASTDLQLGISALPVRRQESNQ